MDHTSYYRDYRRRKEGKPDYTEADMIKCLLCSKLFVFLGCHVYQTHHIKMAEYKLKFGLDRKRGKTIGKFRALKAKTNRGVNNLEKGKKFWFVKGDKQAGRYDRSLETKERLHKQGLEIGKKFGGKK